MPDGFFTGRSLLICQSNWARPPVDTSLTREYLMSKRVLTDDIATFRLSDVSMPFDKWETPIALAIIWSIAMIFPQ
jgi:hypothetical protein